MCTAQCREVRVCTAQCREVRVCTAQCREALCILHSVERNNAAITPTTSMSTVTIEPLM